MISAQVWIGEETCYAGTQGRERVLMNPGLGNDSFSLVIWGFGLFWLIIATSSIVFSAKQEKGLKFSMGWWGFTFPLGVFTTATLQFGTEMDSGAFKIMGTILTILILILWLFVGAMTTARAWTGVM